MGLPNGYTQKPGTIPAYFDTILSAEAPERFSYRFLQTLEFKSTNDRLLVGILKDLAFIDADGIPQQRYFEFLDKNRSRKVLAEAIREAYSDLFSVHKEAHKLKPEEAKNKLRTLYAGTKKDSVIGKIAKTFTALCNYADFSITSKKETGKKEDKISAVTQEIQKDKINVEPSVSLDSLQYHINIVLPESRDQAVYDAIFKSLRDHLGSRHG